MSNQYCFEVPQQNSCIADCSYCLDIHSWRKSPDSKVSPLSSQFQPCNSLKPAPHLPRRVNTRLFRFYQFDKESRVQWLVDGSLPELEAEALTWAQKEGLIDSLMIILREGFDYGHLLSFLEGASIEAPVIVHSLVSSEELIFWRNRTKRQFPKTSLAIDFPNHSSYFFSGLSSVIDNRELPRKPKISLIFSSLEVFKNSKTPPPSIDVECIVTEKTSQKASPLPMRTDCLFLFGRQNENLALKKANGGRLLFIDSADLDIEQLLDNAKKMERFEAETTTSRRAVQSIHRHTFFELGHWKYDALRSPQLADDSLRSSLNNGGFHWKQSLSLGSENSLLSKGFTTSHSKEYQEVYPWLPTNSKRKDRLRKWSESGSLFWYMYSLLCYLVFSMAKTLSDLSWSNDRRLGFKEIAKSIYWALYGPFYAFRTWSYWAAYSSLMSLKNTFVWSLLWPIKSIFHETFLYTYWKALWPLFSGAYQAGQALFWRLAWPALSGAHFICNWLFWNVVWALFSALVSVVLFVFWRGVWPSLYPVRKIYYYLEYKLNTVSKDNKS